MENKEKTRLFLKDQLYSPKCLFIQPGEAVSSEAFNSQMEFPVIVKSPKSTGSKDVLLARGKEQLIKQIAGFRDKKPDETIIIEEYLDGDQYLVEALIINHKAHIIGILEQEITEGKRFIITGYGVLVNVPNNIKTGLEKVLQSIVSSIKLENGALHLEIRLTKNGWKLIEINPRISGGAMNNMIEAAFGFNLVEETLKIFIGETPNITPKHRKYVYTQYVVINEKGILTKVTGRNKAKKLPGILDVYIKPKKGTLLMPPLSMGHRYAYVIATGTSMEEAKIRAKNAADEITFHLKEE